MDDVKLLPCPFCGGAWGIAREPRDNYPVAGMWYLFHKVPRCFFAISPSHFETEAKAVQAWNTRTPSPDHVIMREALELVLGYREGKGRFRFAGMPRQERENAAFDAWQEVEAKVREALSHKGTGDE